ncbi:TRAP transporter substrate-binding protein [Neorhizobium petrolearium]|uniref:Tripartite ATP-independent transporter solute receptor, DctP family n=2 Tax=Rhizobium/Agrobacterium group TaxID=227290 RepID=A0A1X7DSI5_9HYPH|nr:TRAP transporter substrate-binding protein [Xaviernesmea oryzae]SMF20614.1 tripartite ATP-independent transporter solute receptor, DctP family [Xaviernesmea oryzae]
MKGRMTKLAGTIALAVFASIAAGTIATAQEFRAKLGHAMPQEHPQAVALNKFAELAGQYTDGRVKVTVFHGGMLGGDDKMLQSTQSGTQEMFYGSLAPIAGKIKEVQVFDFPFLFGNMKEVDAVFLGPIGEKLMAKLDPHNLHGVAWGETGFRQLSNNKHEVKTADDIKGLKVRVMQNQVALDSWKAIGANALPMSYAEVFTALETGALDGQENPYIHMYANKIYEVQKYGTTTNHVYTPCILVTSKKFWEQLTPADQEAIVKAGKEAMVYLRQLMEEGNAKVVADLEAQGMKVDTLPEAELAKLREATAPVIEKYKPVVGAELVDEIQATIAKVRAGN